MNTKKTVLSKLQERYIDENWEQFTHEAIAATIKVAPSVVSYYCQQKGYRKMKKAIQRIEEKVKEDQQKKRINRPPAIYSNRSHEEVLNYYENLEV
jgi:predicted transcriptional regulator